MTDTLGAYLYNLKCGRSTMDRLRARALESYWFCTWMLGAYDTTPYDASGNVDQSGRAAGFSSSAAATTGWIGQLKGLGFSASGYRHVGRPPPRFPVSVWRKRPAALSVTSRPRLPVARYSRISASFRPHGTVRPRMAKTLILGITEVPSKRP